MPTKKRKTSIDVYIFYNRVPEDFVIYHLHKIFLLENKYIFLV